MQRYLIFTGFQNSTCLTNNCALPEIKSFFFSCPQQRIVVLFSLWASQLSSRDSYPLSGRIEVPSGLFLQLNCSGLCYYLVLQKLLVKILTSAVPFYRN